MGYKTSLQLVGVEIDPRKRSRIETAILQARRGRGGHLDGFLRWLGLTSENTLEFRAACKRDFILPQCPDEEGFVSAVIGKWGEAEEIAEWLCQHCIRGKLILHSLEGDGDAFGWESQAGRIRYLELVPVEKWRCLRPASGSPQPKLRQPDPAKRKQR